MDRYLLELFRDPDGNRPFRRWLDGLDASVRPRIEKRLERMKSGHFGDYRHLERGLLECRLHFGAGYRIHFGLHRDRLILLLGGGDKATQVEDIFLALERWDRYKEHP